MPSPRLLVIALLAVGVEMVAVWAYVRSKEVVTLVALGAIEAYGAPNWEPGKTTPVAMLNRGDTVRVDGCLDIKTDILIRIDVGGRLAYISNGSYDLERRRATIGEAFTGQATSSCRGFFDKPIRQASSAAA